MIPSHLISQRISPQPPVSGAMTFEEQIIKLDAYQIRQIGLSIANQILNNLGPAAKARIQLFVAQKTHNEPMIMEMAERAKVLEEKKMTLLDDEKTELFVLALLVPIKNELVQAFSRPFDFLDAGMSLQLSDSDPLGILSTIGHDLKITINWLNVPVHYRVTLCLEKTLSQDQPTLVFSLKHESEGIEFSKQFFTIERLGQKYSPYRSFL